MRYRPLPFLSASRTCRGWVVRLPSNTTLPTRATGGGSDANVFAARGIEVANLACGMRDIHTVDEWVDVRDLVSTAELLVELIRLNAGPAAAA